MPIKVLVVDDSAVIRSLLSAIINQTPGFELVGAAPNAYVAKDMVMQFAPDVITLDIEMPKVDGLTFLHKLMKARPTPVIMISSLTEKGAQATIRSLELGAIDFIPKSRLTIVNGLLLGRQEIVDKIKMAALSRPKIHPKRSIVSTPLPLLCASDKTIIGLGASTGGTEAIRVILESLPASFPAILITQHMPANFTRSFAQRLNALCRINVCEATDGQLISSGNAYIAPGDRHMEIVSLGANYSIQLSDGAKRSGHKPSVDVMFESLARVVGKNAIATLLTGMGKDGAIGLLSLYTSGAITMVQDEASSVIYGMPKAAVEIGATKHIIPLEEMSKMLTKAVEQKGQQ